MMRMLSRMLMRRATNKALRGTLGSKTTRRVNTARRATRLARRLMR